MMDVLVRTRGRELGVRLACGGTPVHVVGLVIRRGRLVALIGSIAGVAIAWGTGGFLRSLLFGVPPGDVPSLVIGGAVAVLSAALACLAPARRAAATDPAVVLRSD